MLFYSEELVDVPNCCTVLKFTYGLYVYFLIIVLIYHLVE